MKKLLTGSVLVLVMLVALPTLLADSVERMHKEMLYAVVRIRAGNVIGSGTVLFSAKDKQGAYHTYVLTNHHVVDGLISVKREWNPTLKRRIDQEVLGRPRVEIFQYVNLSQQVGMVATEAEIVAYDGREDLALLRLRDTERPAPFVAKLLPRKEITNVHLYDEIWACGAAMGHAPIITQGHIAYENEIIENYEYWLGTALTIFGNSGGAVFRPSARGYEFIGVPSRIVVSAAFGAPDAITHMGFFIPISRVLDFLDRNFYGFIYNPSLTVEACEELRKQQVAQSLGKVRQELNE